MLRASVSPEELGKALVPKLGDGQTFGGINKKKCVSVQKGWVLEKTHKRPQNPTFPCSLPQQGKMEMNLNKKSHPKKAFQKDLGPLWDMGHKGGDAPCAVPVPPSALTRVWEHQGSLLGVQIGLVPGRPGCWEGWDKAG